jgi:hypothetical protein
MNLPNNGVNSFTPNYEPNSFQSSKHLANQSLGQNQLAFEAFN